MIIRGRTWKFGDNINTDLIFPRRFQKATYEPGAIASGLLVGADPEFPSRVSSGDIIVGGRNFGCGSGREEAALALRETRVGGVVAASFGRMFMRNCINLGVPVVTCPGVDGWVDAGDILEIDLEAGAIRNATSGQEVNIPALPTALLSVLEGGGLEEYTRRELERRGVL